MQSPIPIPTWYPGLTHEQLVDEPISVELGQATIDALNSGGPGGPGGSTGLTDTQLRASPVPVSQNIALNSGTASSNTTRTVTASDSPDVATLVSIDGKVLTNSQLIDALATTAVQVTGPLTDAQLRATALPVAPNITRGTGTADTNTQRVVLASNSPGVTDLVALNSAVGNQVDSAATSDSGTFSLIQFVKRGLQNWTTLLSRIPSSVSGRIPVDASGTTIATTDTLNGTRSYNWAAGIRTAFTTASSDAIALPTLGSRREVRIISSERCFVRFGGSAVSSATVAESQAIFPADSIEVIVIPVGTTHFRVIGELSSGWISFTPVE